MSDIDFLHSSMVYTSPGFLLNTLLPFDLFDQFSSKQCKQKKHSVNGCVAQNFDSSVVDVVSYFQSCCDIWTFVISIYLVPLVRIFPAQFLCLVMFAGDFH